MSLKFLGRGSSFAYDHTSAYFSTENNELVIIDCPISAFQEIKLIDLTTTERFYILITRTHKDYIGGLSRFLRYAFFVLKKPVTIIAPSKSVVDDISMFLTVEGNNLSWCDLVTVTDIVDKTWFGSCIFTKPSPQLAGNFFGYHLFVDNTNVVYTGNTYTIEPFIPYLTDNSILYVDASVLYYSSIHLKLEDSLDDFLSFNKKGIKVYLMHLGDVYSAKKIVANYPGIEIVEKI